MRWLLVPALFLAVAPASSQSALDANTVTVSGQGRVSVAPDRALVRLGVLTRAATAPDALREHEEDVARVLTRVRGFGIADRDIEVNTLSLGEDYGPDGPDGYRAQRIVTVTMDSLRRVPDLVAAVVSEGANQLQGIEYVVRDTAPAEALALDRAVADARTKAERIASASGVRLGSVVAVQEGSGPTLPRLLRYSRAESAAPAAAPAPPQPGAYSTGSSEVVADVVVQFLIAGAE